jgi:hypothetical protein
MLTARTQVILLHVISNVLRTTPDHPFFDQGKDWIEAADLHLGDPLLSEDGQHVPVERISDSGEQEVVCHIKPKEYPMQN